MKRFFCSLLCILTSFLPGEFYHGSMTDGIACLEPRLRYTPGGESNAPPAVYASDLPAYAAAHSFPWATREGVDLYITDDLEVILEVPRAIAERLQKNTYIYCVDSALFSLVECETSGHTYRALTPVPVIRKIPFNSVVEAVEYYGGQVIIKEDS